MSLTTLQIFRMIATEYSNVKDEDVEQYIEFSKPLISEKRFGNLYERGLALLTAHTMKRSGVINNAGESGGAGNLQELKSAGVSSYTEGSVSVSFQSSSTTSNVSSDFDNTIYGKQYLELLNALPTITIRGGLYG